MSETELINSSLSIKLDASKAASLRANETPKRCYVGQYPFNDGFLLEPDEARQMISRDSKYRDILFPYIIGRDLVERSAPSRWIIDFGQRDMVEAMRYPEAFERVKRLVMPTVLDKSEKERAATGKDKTRWSRMANRWWQFRDYQPGTMTAIGAIPRYVACSRVTKRPIFEFIGSGIHPDNTVMVFPFSDDYSFGLLQSGLHWVWFVSRCSTLKGDFRYTSETVFDSFPWPQAPTLSQARNIADAAITLRALRRKLMAENDWSLRELYRTLELPGQHPLRTAQELLDSAVRAAYGMKSKADPLSFLLALNGELADREGSMRPIVGPGLPASVDDQAKFISDDCVKVS